MVILNKAYSAFIFILYILAFISLAGRKTKNPFRRISKRVFKLYDKLILLESADTNTHHGVNTHHHRLHRLRLANGNLNSVELLHS